MKINLLTFFISNRKRKEKWVENEGEEEKEGEEKVKKNYEKYKNEIKWRY
jgi:hypothetical protein